MSLGQTIFRRMWAALQRKARNTEDFGERVITNAKQLRRLVYYVGVGYCSGTIFQHYVLRWGESEGMSMYPTMSDKTPFTLTSHLHSHGKNMSPGDIVNFTSPIFRDALAAKRLIGMPGDYVVLDPHQAPSVGGAAVPRITNWRSQSEIEKNVELKEREEPMMLEVPEGHIYVVGDNLSWSRDSRFFGAVPMALVNGKQLMHRVPGQGWQWTIGEQMRRIPKDEEEEYLKSLKQRRIENQKEASEKPPVNTTKKVD